MNTKSLQILALAAALVWQGAAGTRAQQFQPPGGANSGSMGLDQFQAGGPRAMPASYHQPTAMPSYSGPSAPYAGQAAPYTGQVSGPIYDNGNPGWQGPVQDGQYFDPYQGAPYDGGDGGPVFDQGYDAIYPCGQCYAYTRAEVFALTRDIKSNQPFTSLGVGGPIVLSTNNLDFDFEAGVRGVAGVPLGSCLLLEASYFGLQHFDDSAAAIDPAGNLFSVYSGFGQSPGFVVDGRQVLDFTEASNIQAISYTSELHNAELNLMYRVPMRCCKQEAWLLAGARYIKVNEDFQFTTQASTNDPVLRIRQSFTDVQTDNDLVGGQLGGILHHHVTCKFRVSLDGKVGMLANISEQRSFVGTNLFPLGAERVTDESLALVADGGVSWAFDLCCWCSITGGYRMMYLDGVALAPDNFNTQLPQSGLRTPFLDHHGTVLYHGMSLGGEIRW